MLKKLKRWIENWLNPRKKEKNVWDDLYDEWSPDNDNMFI